MGGGAAEIMLRCVFEGSITMQDCLIERRPYHRNCQCALHKRKGSVCSSACSRTRNNILLPKKQPWNDCSMSMSAPKFNISSQSSLSIPHHHGYENVSATLYVRHTALTSQDDKTCQSEAHQDI